MVVLLPAASSALERDVLNVIVGCANAKFGSKMHASKRDALDISSPPDQILD